MPRRNFTKPNTAYNFGGQSLYLGVRVPVWQKASVAESPRIQQVIVSNTNEVSHSGISPGAYSVHQFQNKLGVGYISVGRKNTYQAQASVSAFMSTKMPQPVQFRPMALLLFRRQVTRQWSYRIGLAYSFVFGRGLPLPVIGYSVRLGSRSRLDALLPFSVRYMVIHTRHFTSQASCMPQGFVALADPIANGSEQSILFLRNRAFLLQYKAEIRAGRRVRLYLALGYLFKRQVWISDGTGGLNNPASYFSGQVKPGWALQAGFRIRLGGQKEVRSAPGKTEPFTLTNSPSNQPELNDEDLRQLDVDELIDNQ